ncbi:MAG: hypothetical protein HOF69_05845 [Campylobacteraceae bacterium]|nr:hypothetical protein [Campylobacteraceae bacterium]MBT3882763.1 hypothetical protein [Campylobacteraceae bacterium]MBT4030089.1 hypothetical protein [Campylobacteraceae bacterium]MBT4179423.1 hypothetical protein [Campylobacteraceae bacterium]MBT4572639.1 hypothetical protein [Campylobacteraceae bacterium]
MKLFINILLLSIVFIGCSSTKSNIAQVSISPNTVSQEKNINQNTKQLSTSKSFIKDIFTFKKKTTLLYSSNKLGKYAIDATNVSLAYLITKDKPFDLEIIDMKDESWESFTKALNEAKQKDSKNIVAVITNASYENLIDVGGVENFNIFLPLINKNNVAKVSKNIIYGGVDYQKQFNALLEYSNNKDISLYDNSLFGKILNNQLEEIDNSLLFTKEIDDFSGFYGELLDKNRKKLNNSTLFLNTPIVKSSILLSQIRANKITPNRVLSTQMNYTPLILSLTQADDRKNLIIANSIRDIDRQLKENIANLGCDVVYDWLTYSTLVGVDYFYTRDNRIEPIILDNQVQYGIELYKAKYHSFKKLN